MIEYDAIIIGSGISGMTASIYLKRAGLKVLIIENNAPGGQLLKGYDIENYPGFLTINSNTLAMNLYNQTTNLKIDYLFDNITNIDLDKKIITTSNKNFKTKYIIIATGRRERKLNLDNEQKLIGHGISFCASCDGHFYKDKPVIVAGGSNTAVSEALYLSNICKKVTIIYRNNELRSEKILIDRITKKDNIEIIYNINIIKYNEKDNKLESITLDNNKEIPCDGLFLAIGFIPNTELFNVNKKDNYIIVDDNYMTNINNVYACGDVVLKSTYQLTTASSDATIAAYNIIKDYNL